MDPEWQYLLIFCTQSLDEHDHMMFVLHHLNDILELLMEPGNDVYVVISSTVICEGCNKKNARHGQ